jgi:hypothetical protein
MPSTGVTGCDARASGDVSPKGAGMLAQVPWQWPQSKSNPAGALLVRRRAVLVGLGLVRVPVLVVAQVLGVLTGFVPAIRRHGRPAELERQEGEHEDREPTAHEKSLAATEFETGPQG